jgi:acyl-coenzyme A synthetase/AMP-(fatty) acid ligase
MSVARLRQIARLEKLAKPYLKGKMQIAREWSRTPKRSVALAALAQCPKIELCLVADGPGEGNRVQTLDEATSLYPPTPIADELLGAAMLYSSGTTGRPKGILRPLPLQPPTQPLPLYAFLDKLWRWRRRQEHSP